ncbi:uncharacterized protein LACBIDRAFT_308138, partial [Laccaria bicolor S238N-H82]
PTTLNENKKRVLGGPHRADIAIAGSQYLASMQGGTVMTLNEMFFEGNEAI